MAEGCEKFDKESVQGLHMLFDKDYKDVILNVRTLIRRCLKCDKFKQGCEDKDKLFDFLKSNDQ